MMEIIRMSKKELRIGGIISRTVSGEFSQQRASEELNISLRQVKRLCKRLKEEGVEGLAHKNRGKPSLRKISSNTREEVLELIKRDYLDFGPQLIKEQLEERNQICLSREWIRHLMIKEGLWEVKKRKNVRYYQRRHRRPREGELLQIDGSPEYWFEDRGPKCCLINMVDDATGKIMECRFVKEECLEGYFLGMKRYIEKHGRPLAVYSDRHTIFKSPKLEKKPALTQFGRAMKELEIELIYAYSPQAKGRVERCHGTLQDRLIKIMRLEGISSIEEGNRYLEKFRIDYNKRFGKAPQTKEGAYREIPHGKDLDKILCKKEERKVSKTLEVHYKQTTYQLVPKGNSRKLVGATVLILDLEKRTAIEFQGEEIEYKIYNEQPYQEFVMDRKRIDAFLDRKKPKTIIEKHRKGIAINF
jgi:transposase